MNTQTTTPTLSDDAVLRQAAAWRDAGDKVAIATVVNTWGSSPRPVGSQLVVNEKSQFVGSVSGGCIEGSVVEEALKVMKDLAKQIHDPGKHAGRRRHKVQAVGLRACSFGRI